MFAILSNSNTFSNKWELTDAPKRQQLELSNVIKPSTLKPQEISVSAGVMQAIFIFFGILFHMIFELEGLTKHFKLFELFWPRTNHLWIGWLRMEKMERDRKRWTLKISSFVIKSFVIFKMHKPWHCSLWMSGSFRLRIVSFTLYVVRRAWRERSSSSSFRALSFCRVTRNETTRSPDLKGNSDFCLPLTLNVPLASGKQNSVTVYLGISH